MRVMIQGTSEMSAPFSYSAVHTTMLKLYNKVGALPANRVYFSFRSFQQPEQKEKL
jgi:hypothetical protein